MQPMTEAPVTWRYRSQCKTRGVAYSISVVALEVSSLHHKFIRSYFQFTHQCAAMIERQFFYVVVVFSRIFSTVGEYRFFDSLSVFTVIIFNTVIVSFKSSNFQSDK